MRPLLDVSGRSARTWWGIKAEDQGETCRSPAFPFAFDEMTKFSALATAAILAGSASAHTIFQKLYVNGVDQGELVGIRAPDYDGVRPSCNFVFCAYAYSLTRSGV